MGTLGLRKNVGTLLEAYARLLSRVPDAPRLTLAGRSTPDSARWEARAKEPPLAGHVEFTGYVDAARRIDLYADARMLILPSYEEGFGLPVLEAMACGVPVVVSSRGSLPEVAATPPIPWIQTMPKGLPCGCRRCSTTERRRRQPSAAASRPARYSWAACASAASGHLSRGNRGSCTSRLMRASCAAGRPASAGT